jgi:hypothetical protein
MPTDSESKQDEALAAFPLLDQSVALGELLLFSVELMTFVRKMLTSGRGR